MKSYVRNKINLSCAKLVFPSVIGHSRPVPYSARTDVGKQNVQMMEDGILESSDSSYIYPLTTLYLENKDPCI